MALNNLNTHITPSLSPLSLPPSSSPLLPSTHAVHSGEEIHGSISCVPNDKNVRDLDITIAHQFRGRTMQSENSQLYKLR